MIHLCWLSYNRFSFKGPRRLLNVGKHVGGVTGKVYRSSASFQSESCAYCRTTYTLAFTAKANCSFWQQCNINAISGLDIGPNIQNNIHSALSMISENIGENMNESVHRKSNSSPFGSCIHKL